MEPMSSTAARPQIPQFDGAADGGGEEDLSEEVKGTPEMRWKKTRRLSLGIRRRGDGNNLQQDDGESGSSKAMSRNRTSLVETDTDRKFGVRRILDTPPILHSSVVPASRASQPTSKSPKASTPQKKRTYCEVVVTPPKKRVHVSTGRVDPGEVAGEDDVEASEDFIGPDDEELPSDARPRSFRLRKPEFSFDMSSSPPVPGSFLRSGRQESSSPASRVDKRPVHMATRVEAARPRGPVTRSRSRLSEEGTRGYKETDLEKQGGKTLDWLKKKESGIGVSVEEVFDDERNENREAVRWVLECVDVPIMDRRMMGEDKGWSRKEFLRGHMLDENIEDVLGDGDSDDEIWSRLSLPEEKETAVGDETVGDKDNYLRVNRNGREKNQMSELNVLSTRNSLPSNHPPSFEYIPETSSIIGDDDRIQTHVKNSQVENDTNDTDLLYQSSPYNQAISSLDWDGTFFDELPLPTAGVESDEGGVVSEKIVEVEQRIQSNLIVKPVSSAVDDNGEDKAALEKENTKVSLSASSKMAIPLTSTVIDPLVATFPPPPAATHWSIAPATRSYVFARPPPTTQELEQSLTAEFGLPRVVYREPYFGSDADVPMRPTVLAGKEFRLKSESVRFLAEFDTQRGTGWEKGGGDGDGDGKGKEKERIPGGKKEVVGLEAWKRAEGGEGRSSIKTWTVARMPPSLEEVEQWLEKERKRVGGGEELSMEEQSREVREKGDQITPLTPSVSKKMEDVPQIEGNTPKNKFGFKFSQNKSAAVVHDRQNINIFSVEIHVNTRGQLLPNPSEDPVSVIFWCLQTEDDEMQSNGYRLGYRVGLILTHDTLNVSRTGLTGYDIDYVVDERSMLDALIEKVRQYDPDILTGYEIHNSSWGYLIERADMAYQINLRSELSRVIPATTPKFGREEDAWGFRQTSSINIDGRHMLNVWRLVRSEVDLNVYTFENVAFHILHERIPHFSYATLSTWFTRGPAILKWRVLKYYIDRVQRNLELLEVPEIVSRTSEFARLFGVDFFSIISRGSQFKVESMMLRIAKPENFIMISPNKKQVASQRAAECLPLVMEPESKFYNSPLVVLDFQSLYPSVMIAYNYCYSTCLGKIGPPDGSKKFGVTSLNLPTGLLDVFGDYITVSPNGLMYVKPSVRQSLLAKMLSEILETRVMVKRSMKENKSNKALEKLLNARQLGLKYIANVTYGYTGASFSGRMPGVEIADSIVQTGRETLERAIDVINSTDRWGARVVYGDTDSVFVTLPGRTKAEAFDIGADIAETITKMNPAPIRLKLEKVYHPCVLLAKKRYVGFKYESKDETVPEFDAKGIETVRRDGVPAVQKIMEHCLKILFRTQDLSELKSFLQRQWSKILADRVSPQDFIFAKEVKLGSYSERGLPPPGALVSTRKMVIDPRSEPQYGERVPYVVVHGGPGARLADQVVPPEELLENRFASLIYKNLLNLVEFLVSLFILLCVIRSLRLHGQYYITKQIIPSLERVFNLVGADIKAWFNEMPRIQRATAFTATQQSRSGGLTFRQNNGRTIDQYYTSQHCLVCREVTELELCQNCQSNPSISTFHLSMRQHRAEVKYAQLLDVCTSCSQISAAQATVESGVEAELNDSISRHPCDSMDCPVYFERVKARNEVKLTMKYSGILDRLFEERSEPGADGALLFAGQDLDF
ncbi:hypothetical protein BC937DRAFT_88438 [Endogone sp. FLAS-F59071]|nr:hypothetical protein BC937DRAFT_88438 [Endogone sp. FLAS-F59071]|eukprot:RUS18701.1 hypothetical protein BC937DRAFT_88438 [Endogone sp. FLAS-F59071]